MTIETNTKEIGTLLAKLEGVETVTVTLPEVDPTTITTGRLLIVEYDEPES